MTIDWDKLRLLLKAQHSATGLQQNTVAALMGIHRNVYGEFLRGVRPTVCPRTFLRMLDWLEIYDWREVIRGDHG